MTSVQAIPFANARLRVKRDVLFTETADGVLFHNAHGGFQLNGRSAYRFATLIMPYLNGEHSVRELVEMLPRQQQEMVSNLVRMLLERGLARDVPVSDAEDRAQLPDAVAEHFAAQINYIDHYEDHAARRFHRYRTAKVAVLGDDAVAGWCATALVRNGMAEVAVRGPEDVYAPATAEAAELTRAGVPSAVTQTGDLAGYDLVVCAGDDAPARVVELMRAGLAEGQRLLPFTLYGRRAAVGPMTVAGRRGCWSCAMLRLGSGGDHGAAAQVWRSVTTGGDHTGVRPGRQLSALLGNLLAHEVFRELTQVLAAETEGAVIVQELDSFDTAVTKLAPHPLCRMCGDPADGLPSPVDLARVPLVAPPDTGVPSEDGGTDPAVAELDALTAALVAPGLGVFHEFDDDWPTQLPQKVSVLRFADTAGDARAITAFDVHHAAGARMRALRSAAAAYLDLVTPPRLTDHTGVPAVTALTTASGIGGEHHEWVLARALDADTEVRVPAAAVRPYSRANADRAYLASGAGVGIGTSADAAAYRALMSAVGHQALTAALRGTAARLVDLTTVEGENADGDELSFLVRSASTLEVEPQLLALRTGDATVLLARCRSPHSREPLWAVGADLSARRAVMIALRDLLGQVQVLAQRPDEGVDLGHRMADSFDPFTVAVEGTEALDLATAATASDLLAALRAAGHVAYAVQDGSADLADAGLHAVRVLLAEQES